MNDKDLLRGSIREALKALSDKEYDKLSNEIAHHLIQSSYWKEADVVALTISRKREVDTKELIRTAWKQGKCVVVPQTNFATKRMNFYKIDSFDDLEDNGFGLQEPKKSKDLPLAKEQMDLMVVPGLAFTREGLRLGYGGGFYDRYLPGVRAVTMALAFPIQIIPFIPMEEHDQKIDHIITPSGFCR